MKSIPDLFAFNQAPAGAPIALAPSAAGAPASCDRALPGKPASYGLARRRVQRPSWLFRRNLIRLNRACLNRAAAILVVVLGIPAFAPSAIGQTAAVAPVSPKAGKPLKLVVLGDSLTAGLGLPQDQSFPVKLEQALKAKGENISVINAGVSGDTASGGLDRLEWSVGPDTNAVIVELGANDALRGLDPAVTAKALDAILAKLKARGLPVLLAGMEAPRNLGVSYDHAFDTVFATLSKKYDVIFYPFFLQGVATDPALNQADGMHPNAQGVDVIVRGILPKVEVLLSRARAKPPA